LEEEMKEIYIVSSVYVGTGPGYRFDSRCWGWFPTKEEAIIAAEGNYGDMCEADSYTHIVIERHWPGILTQTELVGWWKFDRPIPGQLRVVACTTPESMSHVVGFGMG